MYYKYLVTEHALRLNLKPGKTEANVLLQGPMSKAILRDVLIDGGSYNLSTGEARPAPMTGGDSQ